jgi:hypothetical protein
MGFLRRILRVVPGPAFVYAQSWVALFEKTHFANPAWRISAENEGLALGTIIMVVLAVLANDRLSRVLRVVAFASLVLTVALFAFCRYIYFHLGPPEPGTRGVDSTWWNEIWSPIYTAANVSAIVTISTAALSPGEERPRLGLWVAAASVFTLLICIAIYFLWLR